ncbi:hypothetical protein GEMRC1_013447 [Eukaryota sp. GEM-RC1]
MNIVLRTRKTSWEISLLSVNYLNSVKTHVSSSAEKTIILFHLTFADYPFISSTPPIVVSSSQYKELLQQHVRFLVHIIEQSQSVCNASGIILTGGISLIEEVQQVVGVVAQQFNMTVNEYDYQTSVSEGAAYYCAFKMGLIPMILSNTEQFGNRNELKAPVGLPSSIYPALNKFFSNREQELNLIGAEAGQFSVTRTKLKRSLRKLIRSEPLSVYHEYNGLLLLIDGFLKLLDTDGLFYLDKDQFDIIKTSIDAIASSEPSAYSLKPEVQNCLTSDNDVATVMSCLQQLGFGGNSECLFLQIQYLAQKFKLNNFDLNISTRNDSVILEHIRGYCRSFEFKCNSPQSLLCLFYLSKFYLLTNKRSALVQLLSDVRIGTDLMANNYLFLFLKMVEFISTLANVDIFFNCGLFNLIKVSNDKEIKPFRIEESLYTSFTTRNVIKQFQFLSLLRHRINDNQTYLALTESVEKEYTKCFWNILELGMYRVSVLTTL